MSGTGQYEPSASGLYEAPILSAVRLAGGCQCEDSTRDSRRVTSQNRQAVHTLASVLDLSQIKNRAFQEHAVAADS
eukprot:1355429-Rhodomonas_salina.3